MVCSALGGVEMAVLRIIIQIIFILVSIALAVLVGVFLLMVTLPTFKMQTSGIENYQREYCHVGLTYHLYPGEDFLTRYAYVNGDYHYYCNGVWGDMYRIAFSVLEYTPEEYEAAKEYCFQQFPLRSFP